MSKFHLENRLSAFLRQARAGLCLFMVIFWVLLMLFLFGVTSGRIDLVDLKDAFADLALCWDLFLVTAPVAGFAYSFDWAWESMDRSPAKEHPVCETLGFAAGWLLGWGVYLLNLNNIATVSFPALWFFASGAAVLTILKVMDDITDCVRKRRSGKEEGQN